MSTSSSLKLSHVKRYSEIATLLIKYGRGDVVSEAGWEEHAAANRTAVAAPAKAEELAKDLEAMGPTFVKLGQLLSSRADLLPPPYIHALTRLQDDVAPFPYEDVERIVTEELGVRISKAFLEFEREPMAAASLGQVHRAVLRDGSLVVVKVQRPEIRKQMLEDLDALQEIAGVLDRRTKLGRHFHFTDMMEQFRKTLLSELDYRREANHLALLANNLADFERLVVPRPVPDYTAERVLTMERIEGTKISGVSPVALVELDGDELAEQLFQAYLKQIFIDGFFHADPHPGNVFITPDGRVALLDLGMTARLAPRMQEQLLQMVLAISEGRADDVGDMALRIGETAPDFKEKEFRERVQDVVEHTQDATLGELQIGKVFLDMAKHAGETGIRLPPELTVLGKALLNLDGIGRILAPEFDPSASIQRNSSRIMRQRMIKTVSPGNIYGSLLEVKDLVTRLPARMNKILDAAADNELGFKLDTGIDAHGFMLGLQTLANRVTFGVIVGALLVGAALLMHVPTNFTIFGYPGLGMLFFLTGIAGALILLVDMLVTDRRKRRQAVRAAAQRQNGGS
ncbi:MAG TPA: AarF/ABC1/UbiB kinase family protein [Gemmatimonadales bacterium]|jgi:predicted unusual protein kinase regulating ubiquinone biosynthesis (AarF/ABC1/UbiB family)